MRYEQPAQAAVLPLKVPLWRRTRRRDLWCAGYGAFVLIMLLFAWLLGVSGLLPGDPDEMDLRAVLQPPLSEGHLLGTDYLGRDILVRLLLGIQAWFLPGLLAVGVSLGLGVVLGVLAGYRGGYAGTLVNFVGNLIDSFPRLVLILLIIASFQADVYYIMAVAGLTTAPMVATIIADRIVLLKRKQFIESATALGIPVPAIIFRHILWYNCRNQLLIQASFVMAEAVMIETSLSYLGFGVQEPAPSWGNMIESGAAYLLQGNFWPSTIPAAAILLAVLGLHLLGDALNNILERRQ